MNQRQFFRVNNLSFVTVSLSKAGDLLLYRKEPFEAELRDISGNGLSFVTDRSLPVEALYTWQFAFELLDKKFDLYGQIRWKKEAGALFQYGAEFIFLNPRMQENLIFALNQLQVRRRH